MRDATEYWVSRSRARRYVLQGLLAGFAIGCAMCIGAATGMHLRPAADCVDTNTDVVVPNG